MGITRCSAEPQHWGPVAQKRGGARTQQHWGLEGPSSEPALCSSAETSGWCGLTRELEPGPSDQKGRQGRLGPAQPSCELLRTLPHGKGVHGLLQSLGCGSHIGGWGGGPPGLALAPSHRSARWRRPRGRALHGTRACSRAFAG